MKTRMKLLVLAFFLAVLIFVPLASGAQASVGNWSCTVDPSHGPVGTTFSISCTGFTPGRISNIYAVEPDGRASGFNFYGFFPTSVKADSNGLVAFSFVTENPVSPFLGPLNTSVPPGTYTFVAQELVPNGGGAVNVLAQIPVTVDSSPRPLTGATLTASGPTTSTPFGGGFNVTYSFVGTGYVPGEAVNIWVTAPPGTECSGLGIDQLTLGALGANTSNLWFGPGTVIADASGTIAFDITFRASACRGVHTISARALGSGIGAEVDVEVVGSPVSPTGAELDVSPDTVNAFGSSLTVSGTGFPPNTGVSCWFTRPDGRVLAFINRNVTTDASGSFSVASNILGAPGLDDFPPLTSTEPGTWTVTCATSDRSALATYSFTVVALPVDP